MHSGRPAARGLGDLLHGLTDARRRLGEDHGEQTGLRMPPQGFDEGGLDARARDPAVAAEDQGVFALLRGGVADRAAYIQAVPLP